MFTGIITDVGTIRAIERTGDLRVTIATAYDPASIAIGASIACSGACLTVVDRGAGEDGDGGWFAVDMSAETVARTASGLWTEGGRLNLERALRVGDELGGHIVTGHVDAVGTVVAVAADGASTRVEIAAPPALASYLAAKGSITIDGISLTVNDVTDEAGGGARFGINVIPHTAAVTTLAGLAVGREVNLEIDVLARYLGRMRALEG